MFPSHDDGWLPNLCYDTAVSKCLESYKHCLSSNTWPCSVCQPGARLAHWRSQADKSQDAGPHLHVAGPTSINQFRTRYRKRDMKTCSSNLHNAFRLHSFAWEMTRLAARPICFSNVPEPLQKLIIMPRRPKNKVATGRRDGQMPSERPVFRVQRIPTLFDEREQNTVQYSRQKRQDPNLKRGRAGHSLPRGNITSRW